MPLCYSQDTHFPFPQSSFCSALSFRHAYAWIQRDHSLPIWSILALCFGLFGFFERPTIWHLTCITFCKFYKWGQWRIQKHVIKKNIFRIELAINVLFIYPTRPTCSQHEKSYVSIFPSCQRKVTIDNGNLLPW